MNSPSKRPKTRVLTPTTDIASLKRLEHILKSNIQPAKVYKIFLDRSQSKDLDGIWLLTRLFFAIASPDAFYQLRDFLQIHQLLYGLRTTAGQEAVKVEDAILAVKSWFQGHRGKWLLVFDSADAIDDKTDSAYIDLRHYVPDASSVHVIITTATLSVRLQSRTLLNSHGDILEGS
jgi:hypothetical protein